MHCLHTRLIASAVLLAVVLPGAGKACADSLTLTNGDTFTGQLSRITEGTLVFRTALAGQMMVPMDTVQSLATERNFVVTLAGDRTHYGRLDIDSAGAGERIVPLEGGEPIAVRLADVTEAMPLRSAPAESAAAEPAPAEPRAFTLEAGVGAQWREGNAERLEPVGRLQLSGGEEGSRVSAELEVAHSGTDEVPGYASGGLLVEDTTNTTGLYGRVEALRNADAALAARARLGLGLRHLLYEDDTSLLTLHTGGAAALERWDADLVPDYRKRLFDRTTKSEEDLELELGLRYSKVIFGQSRLEEAFGLYPSLTQPGEFRAQSDTVLRVPLNNAVQLRLNLRLYYESDPAFAGLDPWETSVGAGVAVEF